MVKVHSIQIWHVLVCCFTRFSVPFFTVHATLQIRTHQSRSHPPVKVSPTSQGLTHQSRSSPPVKVTPTGQGRTYQARRHPPFQVAPTSQGRFATWRALCHSIVGSACPAMHSTNKNLPYQESVDHRQWNVMVPLPVIDGPRASPTQLSL